MEHITTLSRENATLRQTQSVAKRPNRPMVEASSSDNDWALFLDTWGRYKRMTRLVTEDGITMELRACCSIDVNRLLFDFIGPEVLNRATEEDLLNHIKSVAVKGVHKEVHRLTFTKIQQADNEPVTQFVARLKAQATLCDFSIECPSGCGKVSYAEDMISHQLVAGLRNQEFQSRILSEATSLNTLKLKVDRLQTLESTEESSQFMQPTMNPDTTKASASRKSQYQSNKNKNPPQYKPDRYKTTNKQSRDPGQSVNTCKGCGRQSHSPGKTMSRKDCPAFDKKCLGCGIIGHFKAVCQRSKASSSREADNDSMEEEDSEEQSKASTSLFF